MCKKDIELIKILNKMRINKQSDEDIQYINSHCHRTPPIDPFFPYVFYKNKDVKKHNERMHPLVSEELVIPDAIDEQEKERT